MENPKIKKAEDLVPIFNYDILETIKLPRLINSIPVSFDQVILKRKSDRNFDQISLQQLSDLLWYTSKVKMFSIQNNGYILTHRGSASAGARHPIDIVIFNKILLKCENFHYYNPFNHSLNKLADPSKEFDSFLKHLNEIVDSSNATVVWFIAHKVRTSAKYSNADSLIWRDAGALINSFQMVSTAMGLKSCPVGSLGEPYLSKYFNSQEDIVGAGGILIG